jgi:hypothetical protein
MSDMSDRTARTVPPLERKMSGAAGKPGARFLESPVTGCRPHRSNADATVPEANTAAAVVVFQEHRC